MSNNDHERGEEPWEVSFRQAGIIKGKKKRIPKRLRRDKPWMLVDVAPSPEKFSSEWDILDEVTPIDSEFVIVAEGHPSTNLK